MASPGQSFRYPAYCRATLADSPVRYAYRYYLEKAQQPTRPSWDQTAVLVGV